MWEQVDLEAAVEEEIFGEEERKAGFMGMCPVRRLYGVLPDISVDGRAGLVRGFP